MKGWIVPFPYTREEYDALMADRDRNLLDDPIQPHRRKGKSDGDTDGNHHGGVA